MEVRNSTAQWPTRSERDRTPISAVADEQMQHNALNLLIQTRQRVFLGLARVAEDNGCRMGPLTKRTAASISGTEGT
ncbi:hypothetical protein H6P81_013281 [Aristolochia fimbriata]|uniref:Uncharacterized protein n=1 Tax=Aristolochia fimbriata TaxID=158543 RepID=A0AAV7EIX8_ARIFI|nr:hypothetical protein H6P81_013281 [Aristolochia fimbriata]